MKPEVQTFSTVHVANKATLNHSVEVLYYKAFLFLALIVNC